MPKAKSKEEQHVSALNPDEMKAVLRHNITNNQYLENRGRPKVSSEMKGESGIGKTSISYQVADEFKLNHIKLNLAQIEELGDLVGYPIKQYQAFKGTEERWIDEVAIDFFVNKMGYDLTGENRMSYAPPFWIADNKKSGGILLIDDWTRGDSRFVQATMELISRQEYISWKLPANYHIILTSNPDDGEYQVNVTDKAQRTRYISHTLKFDIDVWAKWAEENGIDGRGINFALANPEIFSETGETNPRSITTFFDSISSIKDFENEKNLALITMMGLGSVGQEVSLLFATFIHNKLDKLISPEEMLDVKQNEKDILNKIFKLTHEGDNYRADIASIIVTRLINYTSFYAKENPISDGLIKRITKIFSNKMFATDIASNAVKRIHASHNKFQPLLLQNELIQYIAK
jgi:hypothetical protein